MIKAVDLRRGTAVRYKDSVYVVTDSKHVAKGNKRSLMQVKLKNLSTGQQDAVAQDVLLAAVKEVIEGE